MIGMTESAFEEAHDKWIREHLASRSEERRGRLERGHGHGEKLFARNVWWPLRGDLEGLHPEYEVPDWRGRSYFADFAWLPGHLKLVIEVKGFAAHVRDMDRLKYAHELNRELFLQSMGYRVVSFAYDDVEQRPELCILLLRMLLSRFRPEQAPPGKATPAEMEVVRLAIQIVEPLRPIDVAAHLDIHPKSAVTLLRRLVDKGWLKPHRRGSGARIVRYELTKHALDYFC